MSLKIDFLPIAAVSGTFDGEAAGTAHAGTTVNMSTVRVGCLAAKTIVLAQTNTLTITGKWQVSSDNSTFFDTAPENNAANVALATGTAGADTAVTKVIAAPDAAYCYPFSRFVVSNGVAQGAAADTWSIAYNYQKRSIENL